MSDSSEPKLAFHSDDLPNTAPKEAAFHIIPVPWEASVSYGSGTALGPAAILEASTQLEVHLDGSQPGLLGIHTTEPIDCAGEAVEVLDRIQSATARSLRLGKLPILLGGEHAMTLGPVKACLEAGHDIGVVQFDAHADLRDTYQGTPYSHACVMKRIHDLGVPIFQVGVRALSQEEVDLRVSDGIPYLDADEIARNGLPDDFLPAGFPQKVFITFDVDGLDPSIMPATGTPEPGGLSWWQALEGMSKALRGRQLIGADFVELAPIDGLHHPDFTTAKLVYSLMRIAEREKAIS